MVPRSVSDACMPSLLLSPWRSSTFWATTSPLKFCQGPRPMRSRALTACAPFRGLGAQVGAPGLAARSRRLRQCLALTIRSLEAPEVGALARPRAGDEEGHVRRLRRRLLGLHGPA